MVRTKQGKRTSDGASTQACKRPCKPTVSPTATEVKEAKERADIIQEIVSLEPISAVRAIARCSCCNAIELARAIRQHPDEDSTVYSDEDEDEYETATESNAEGPDVARPITDKLTLKLLEIQQESQDAWEPSIACLLLGITVNAELFASRPDIAEDPATIIEKAEGVLQRINLHGTYSTANPLESAPGTTGKLSFEITFGRDRTLMRTGDWIDYLKSKKSDIDYHLRLLHLESTAARGKVPELGFVQSDGTPALVAIVGDGSLPGMFEFENTSAKQQRLPPIIDSLYALMSDRSPGNVQISYDVSKVMTPSFVVETAGGIKLDPSPVRERPQTVLGSSDEEDDDDDDDGKARPSTPTSTRTMMTVMMEGTTRHGTFLTVIMTFLRGVRWR